MAAVSAEGSTVWVLIRRLNSSWSRSIALVVRALFHWAESSIAPSARSRMTDSFARGTGGSKPLSSNRESHKLDHRDRTFNRKQFTGDRMTRQDARRMRGVQ